MKGPKEMKNVVRKAIMAMVATMSTLPIRGALVIVIFGTFVGRWPVLAV